MNTKTKMKMKTTVKALLLMVTAFVFTTDVFAQKISAAAVVDQHYAAEFSNYRLMMFALGVVYACYLLFSLRRKRQMRRFMGGA
jgi:hypothetical protein